MRAALLAVALALSACAAPTGDFGRPKPTYLNETVLPLIGREMARGRGEPVSYFMLTDREQELRARTYRFVMPIHRLGLLTRSKSELVRTRVWPDEMYSVDPTLYYRKLEGKGFASSQAPYNAMASEIGADALLIPAYYTTVRKVCLADARRMAALGETVDVTPGEAADVHGRIYENRRVIDWALAALNWRVESYAYALQRARIAIPSKREQAVAVALDGLAAEVAELEVAVAALACDGSMTAQRIASWGPPAGADSPQPVTKY